MKKLLILLLFPLMMFSQEWIQIGQNILGSSAEDNSGYSISINDDGTIIAIGSPWGDLNGNNSGHVSIYQFDGQSWLQIGQDIVGEEAGAQAGFSVSLSSDGSFIAIGSPECWGPGANPNVGPYGQVEIYNYNPIANIWNQIGEDIVGENPNDDSGHSVSISNDGYTVAIGSPYNNSGPGQGGSVRVYNFDGISWNQISQDIDGEDDNDWSGWSVSLSGDGTIVAIGAIGNEGVNGSSGGSSNLNPGHVRVYQNTVDNQWSQIGQDIDGEADGDTSGHSVSINDDGTIIAIGAPYNDGNVVNSGHVRVYGFDGNTWIQLGQDIDGEVNNIDPSNADNSGYSVSISADGNLVAIGSPYNDNFAADAGHVRVYNFDGNSWIQLGQDIEGEVINDYSGYSVSISADGSLVAIGAPFNDDFDLAAGHVRLFGFDSDGDGNPLNDTDDNSNEGSIQTILIGDVDCSGEVNSQDAALILQYVTNVIDSLPCSYASIIIDNQTLLGCTDENASNYNDLATVDDGSCDTDGDGVADIDEVFGCTYEDDPNYNELATEDDGSCEPYVGMYAFGGVIYRIEGSTAYIINVDEEVNTLRTLSNCSNIVSNLTTGGYDDWQIPSESELDYICPQKLFIDLVAGQNGSTVFFEDNTPYISGSTYCNGGNNGAGPYCILYYMDNTGGSNCTLGGYSGNCCCQVAYGYLRSIRTQVF